MALTPRAKVKEAEAPPVTPEVGTLDVEKKIKEINASGLPESEKREYIARLTGNKSDASAADRVPFTVWANSRNIRQNIRVGMLVFPKAKGVADATFEEWDSIFKDF